MAPLSEDLKQRTVIIGNAGSGKTWLATKLSILAGVPAIDLDRIHWDDANFSHKRDEGASRRMVRDEAARPNWIIEGVYGWLAECAIPRATSLIWLDMPWAECRAGLLARGPRYGSAALRELLTWAERYETRLTSSSFRGHLRLFDSFSGTKLRLCSRDEVLRLVDG